MKALLVIDITEFYLSEINKLIPNNEINTLLTNIQQRIISTYDETIFVFSDCGGDVYPSMLSYHLWENEHIRKPDMSAFSEENFHNILQSRNIHNLEVCGLYTEWCIFHTVYDALELDYNVTINPNLILGERGRVGKDLRVFESLQDNRLNIL